MATLPEGLRVALIVGTLCQGGAEKQLFYMARALHRAGIAVRVYSLTKGGFYERALQSSGIQSIFIGRFSSPMFRLLLLAALLWRFRPHVIQSAHTYVNLYAILTGKLLGKVSLGAMRSNLRHTEREVGNWTWTRWSINTPSALLVNSQKAINELACRGFVEPTRIFLLPNVIDPSENSITALSLLNTESVQQDSVTAVFVGRLVPTKRVDRFIEAISLARQRCPNLRGLIIGDGPERHNWENSAIQKGLLPPILTFIGQRDDVPHLLMQSDMLVLCSDDEGFPNVILEAMLARLPVITTPAGDSDLIVENEINGYVVPFSDTCAMAERMVRLAESPRSAPTTR